MSQEEWASLPTDLKNPLNIYYDTNSNHILYIVKNESNKGTQLSIEIAYSKLAGGNMIVSAYKTPMVNFRQRIKDGLVTQIM